MKSSFSFNYSVWNGALTKMRPSGEDAPLCSNKEASAEADFQRDY